MLTGAGTSLERLNEPLRSVRASIGTILTVQSTAL